MWESRRGMALKTAAWLGAVERLPEIAERLLRVQIESLSFEKLIPAYDTPDTFFYLDPPYLHETRKDCDSYRHEMTTEQHLQLLELVRNVRGKVMLSGYANSLYNERLGDWIAYDFEIACRSTVGAASNRGSHNKSRREERVWLNYVPTQLALELG